MSKSATRGNARRALFAAFALALFTSMPAWAQSAGVIENNVIVNGDFESGTNWGGTVIAPEGWTNVQAGGASYLPPETVPISGERSLITDEGTVFSPGNRGQITRQDVLSVGPRWRLQYDATFEDPPVEPPEQNDRICQYLTISDVGPTNTNSLITIWIRDMQPDNGVGELWLRTSTPPDPRLLGEVAGFGFTDNLAVSNLTHQIVIDGHFDDVAPSFDITVNLHDGSTVAFTGLNAFQTIPQQGDSPDRITFVGDNFSSGLGKIDNVAMGTVVPRLEFTQVTVDGETGLQFNSSTGTTYALRFTVPPDSDVLDTGLRIDGDGGVQTAFDPQGFDTNRAYQVIELGGM